MVVPQTSASGKYPPGAKSFIFLSNHTLHYDIDCDIIAVVVFFS